jgi:iron(III) transport system ATP-binding protein
MTLAIRDLTCHYGNTVALRGLTLEVADGELLVLLGPSGSGKTTLLSLLAGILAPSGGEIRIGDEVLSRPGYVRAPEERHIGFVFQDFALWPHMTVAETIEFPLRMKRVPRDERRRRVAEVLGLVHLDGYGARYPHELSGGQRQRVAIARALAPKPQLVLLDEPMSNLDAKLREQMRIELQDVLRHEHVTAIYVTHDRLEALAMADRVAIVDEGRLVQVAPPEAVYHTPATVFAAGFIGPAALLPVELYGGAEGDRQVIALPDGTRATVPGKRSRTGRAQGTWVIRPENVRIVETDAAEGEVALSATVRSSTYAGSHWQLELYFSEEDRSIVCHHAGPVDRGQRVMLAVNQAATWLIPDTGPALSVVGEKTSVDVPGARAAGSPA